MALEVLDDLADRIHSRWSAVNFDEALFAELSAAALRETELSSRISGAEIVSSLIAPWRSTDNLSTHGSSAVVPLLSSTHFEIRAHLWVDEIGSPHQHGWAGAYQVIEGSSLQTRLTFHQLERIRRGFHLGELETHSIGMLKPGDTVAVEPGREMIHALWHIDRPAVSISVRTKQHTDRTMDCLRPGLAYEAQSQDVDSEMRNRCLAFLARFDDSAYQDQLKQLVSHADLPTTFFALRQAYLELEPVSEGVLATARSHHGDLFPIVERSLEDLSRLRTFTHLRSQVREPEARLFLGLLYMAQDREAIRTFLTRYRPDVDLSDAMGEYLANLLIRQQQEGEGLPAGLPRALGQIASGVGLKNALEELEATSASDQLPRLAELVRNAHGQMQKSVVFSPLFASP